MGYIVFTCPICGADLQVDDRLKGGLAKCYQCESTVMVPMSGVHEGMELGRYVLDTMLGEGGMGQVWLAKQRLTDLDVAIKILSPALTASPESVAKFMREIELSSKLKHPNLVTVVDVGAENGVYYYVTDYIDGENLKEKLERETLLYEKDALQIVGEVASALQYAWEKCRVIHSDISPSNIMIDEDGNVKILDLGIARTAEKDKTLTQTGMIVGSPHYMSPEQALGDREIDFRADVYGLGATLYHLVTGRVPYDGKNAISIITKHVNENLPLPNTINPNISSGCCALICQMLAKQKENRPQSWDEVLESFDIVLAGKTPQIKLEQTDSTRFDNTSFQKINLQALRNINMEAPKAERSDQPRPEKEKIIKRKKQQADKQATLNIKSSKKTQMSIPKASGKTKVKSPQDKNLSKRMRLARMKAKKSDPTWWIVGIAAAVLVVFLLGFVFYKMSKDKQDARERELQLQRKLRRVNETKKSSSAAPDPQHSQPAKAPEKAITQTPPPAKKAPATQSTNQENPMLKSWVTANTERGKKEKPIASGEMAKVNELVEKAKDATGRLVNCSIFGDNGAIKPENIPYDFTSGVMLRFGAGDYRQKIDIPIMANAVVEGTQGAKLREIRLFGEEGRLVVRNLNCDLVKITGDCIFYNCNLQTVILDEGTAIFSKCLLVSVQTGGKFCTAFINKCKISAEKFKLPKGLIYCSGSAVIKLMNSAIIPQGNQGIVVANDFSGKLYVEECYLPSSSLGAFVGTGGDQSIIKDWKNMTQNSKITFVNCHES